MSPEEGIGWTADAMLSGPQHKGLYISRPVYQAAGAWRGATAAAQNIPSDVFVATHGDAQHAIGIICVGVADSFYGDIAARTLGAELYNWIWQHRANPPVERDVVIWLQSQHVTLAERGNYQGLSNLLNRGGPADLLRRRDQLGSQTQAGFYILALDGSLTFYLLGPLRLYVYSTDLLAPPSRYTGNQGAMWSSRNGLNGQPVTRTLRPVQGVSLSTAQLPAEWGDNYKLLYYPEAFSAAAQAVAATASVGFVGAMVDPRSGPTTGIVPQRPQDATLSPPPALRIIGEPPPAQSTLFTSSPSPRSQKSAPTPASASEPPIVRPFDLSTIQPFDFDALETAGTDLSAIMPFDFSTLDDSGEDGYLPASPSATPQPATTSPAHKQTPKPPPATPTEPSAIILTREQRRRLLDTLESIPTFDTASGRNMLLADLPRALTKGVDRSGTTRVDLYNLVRAAEDWGTLDDGTPALLRLLDNALDNTGGARARTLHTLRSKLFPDAPTE
jgi:hypothetical protein